MKKLFLFGLIGLFSLAGCSKDDSDEVSVNLVELDGQSYPLTYADKLTDKFIDPYYTYSFTLSEGAKTERGWEGDLIVYFVLESFNADQLASGTYTYYRSSTYEEPTTPQPEHSFYGYTIHDEDGDGIVESFETARNMDAGTITVVSQDGGQTIDITFEVTLSNGQTFTGKYKGRVN